jgi:hypothetical protein
LWVGKTYSRCHVARIIQAHHRQIQQIAHQIGKEKRPVLTGREGRIQSLVAKEKFFSTELLVIGL